MELLADVWQIVVALAIIAIHWSRENTKLNGFGSRLNRAETKVENLSTRQEDIGVIGNALNDVRARLQRIEQLLDRKVDL